MRKEILTTLGLFATLELSKLAFTRSARREVGIRDHWTCNGLFDQPCTFGKDNQPASWDDGFWVNAAHIDHDKKSDFYNNPNNGRILCSTHHAMEHLMKGEEWEAESILSHGVYNVHYVKKTGRQTILELDQLRELLERSLNLVY